MKQKALNWLSIISLVFTMVACNSNEKITKNDAENLTENTSKFAWQIDVKTIKGNTQGSTFVIKTSDDSLKLSSDEVESLLLGFDNELSGYIPTSLLSKINKSEGAFKVPVNAYFTNCFNKSKEVYDRTQGYFDPSVLPLVRAWGFFKDPAKVLSQQEVDSCLNFISFEEGKNYTFLNGEYKKLNPNFEIDFNAIAQGLSVDVVAELLDRKQQENYFIEIGGEVITKGVNNEGKPWVLGIDQPIETNTGVGDRPLENYIGVSNKAIATSGNYRKVYEIDGRKFSHTINPKTGYSVKHNLLSVTVVADDCATADAYATTFMVIGKTATLAFLSNNLDLNLEVYLLFQNEDGRIERAYSSGMAKMLLN